MNSDDPFIPGHAGVQGTPGAPAMPGMPADAVVEAAASAALPAPEGGGGTVSTHTDVVEQGGDDAEAAHADTEAFAAPAAASDELPESPEGAAENLGAAGSIPAAAPTVKTPAGANTWNPEAVPAVSAAKAAADFVAQIFADVSAPESGADNAAGSADAAGQTEGAAAPQESAESLPLPPAREAVAQLLQGRRVLVLGLGASGLAMARWCARCGADVTVADTRAAPPQLTTLQQELPQLRFVAGPFDAKLVEGQALDAIYRSPGLAPQAIAPVLGAASAYGISVGGELGLYSMALDALRASHGYAPAVLAVTGTNGKTTVTSLTGQLLERSGRSVAVAGNIGPTLLDTLAAHLDADTLPEVWVLELSSFQLDGATGFEPSAATVLNITQDHLDWHGDMPAYAAAKARIFGDKGLMVLNREDPAVMAMLPPPVKVKLQKPQVREHITFGSDMPRRPGDFGIEVVNGMPWLVRAMEADETAKRGRNAVQEELHIQRLMPADALRIRGRHNAANALAALALATAAGCSLAPLLYGLREYRGEPHRVESVAIINGVEYFDDSKGTNVGATVAALTGLGADRRLVVVLGGDGKGQDFSPLAAPVARYARAVVLIGRDAPQIRTALQDSGVPLLDAESMPHAVALATQRAHAGDAVLMSPACASFDMFKSYEHRAQVFCEAVRALADDAMGGSA